MIFADDIQDPGLSQSIACRAMKARENKSDRFPPERLDQVDQRPYARSVHVVERLRIEDQPTNRRRCAGYAFTDSPFDIACVGEEQPIIEPVDQHARYDLRR